MKNWLERTEKIKLSSAQFFKCLRIYDQSLTRLFLFQLLTPIRRVFPKIADILYNTVNRPIDDGCIKSLDIMRARLENPTNFTFSLSWVVLNICGNHLHHLSATFTSFLCPASRSLRRSKGPLFAGHHFS